MKKFEYQQVEYSRYPSIEELNKAGINGWEFVHIFPIRKRYFDLFLNSYYTKEIYKVTFKREIHGSN
jgi:hypothetical protein